MKNNALKNSSPCTPSKGGQYSVVYAVLLFSILSLISCDETKKGTDKDTTGTTVVKTPDYSKFPAFSADSAYNNIKAQVDFGPRIPNTTAHVKCGKYLTARFKALGLATQEQEFTATGFDGKKLKGKNIIASYNPKAAKRIIISAHWDTRPWSDEDDEKPDGKLDGANDGASGVGVILELARVLQTAKDTLAVGVDFILFDIEDYGKSHKEDSYCLGSQYWSKQKHLPNYSAFYGILLDMVGAKGARFNKEGYSMNYAPSVVNKIWDTGVQSGYGSFFIHQMGGGITDDHYYVNKIANIPMVDIIEYDPVKGFGDYWHTRNDNMEVIDRSTLKAVGQTLVNVLYAEK